MTEAPKTLLIIEDELSLQHALHDALTRKGFSCITAPDGETGLKKALSLKPDLILLDLFMPVMDGMTMLKTLRTDPWGVDARVLILTNLSVDTTAHVQNIVTTAPEYYLVKSDWSIDDIVSKVERMLI